MSKCARCKQVIQDGAVKCAECGSYQGWRHVLAWYVPATSVLFATILGIPALYGIYNNLIQEQKSNVRLLSVTFEGDLLSAQLINLGEKPALLSRVLECKEQGVEQYALELSVFGNERASDAQLSEILIYQGLSDPTLINWDVWNAHVEGARLDELSEEQTASISERLEEIVAQEYAAPDDPQLGLASRIVETLGQAGYLPMENVFNYQLSLSARLLESGVREPQDEYEFICMVTGQDETGEINPSGLKISFGVGSYSAAPVDHPFEQR